MTVKFKLPPLYPIVNLSSSPDAEKLLMALLDTPAGIIQLRDKSSDSGRLLEFTRFACFHRNESRAPTRIIVNDSVEICLSAGADGVHLGQEDLAPAQARKALGQGKLIGLSTHSIAQLLAAHHEPVDYLGFGPIFLSSTKSGHAPELGIPRAAQAAKLSKLPFSAIGGVTLKSAEELYRAGVCSVAVISELEGAADPRLVLASYEDAFKRARAS